MLKVKYVRLKLTVKSCLFLYCFIRSVTASNWLVATFSQVMSSPLFLSLHWQGISIWYSGHLSIISMSKINYWDGCCWEIFDGTIILNSSEVRKVSIKRVLDVFCALNGYSLCCKTIDAKPSSCFINQHAFNAILWVVLKLANLGQGNPMKYRHSIMFSQIKRRKLSEECISIFPW